MASEHRAVVVRRAAAAGMPVAAELFREYTASIAHICAASFAQQNIEQELRTLPGKYAEPAGCKYKYGLRELTKKDMN